ncbi:MAG: hypothetical protein KKD44_20575 [Proteobacteria bacterium]|nr:hypothetical protein [Pseudomonadota bacterium]
MSFIIKRLAGFFFVFLMAGPCWSQGTVYGVGFGATEDGTALYFPVKMNQWMVEPFVSYETTKQTDQITGTDYSGTSETKEIALGMGFYYIPALNEYVNLVCGAQIVYVDVQDKTTDSTGTIFGDFSMTGFEFAPTLGIEYNFNEHLSLGAYLRYAIQRVSGDYTSDTNQEFERDVDSSSTQTELIAKYYF